eukprot:COSAG01_NODE_20734_length_938_cov_0.943981_2_plen_76_part_00
MKHAAARVACLQEERSYARIKAHSTAGAQGGVDAAALDTLLRSPSGSGALAAVLQEELQAPLEVRIYLFHGQNRG